LQKRRRGGNDERKERRKRRRKRGREEKEETYLRSCPATLIAPSKPSYNPYSSVANLKRIPATINFVPPAIPPREKIRKKNKRRRSGKRRRGRQIKSKTRRVPRFAGLIVFIETGKSSSEIITVAYLGGRKREEEEGGGRRRREEEEGGGRRREEVRGRRREGEGKYDFAV